ncbi:MAG TPA: panthothenate synthetase [Casimicrobiaceae bacterium]|nr:panthothenate synthetase [Casimicrobiaceae bacterium]
MRMMLTASIPNEPFNSLVRSGEVGKIIQDILAELKPEATYFVEEGGQRCTILIVEIADQSRIPSYAEPFFLKFNATCRFRVAMVPEDLGKAGLEALGKRWK